MEYKLLIAANSPKGMVVGRVGVQGTQDKQVAYSFLGETEYLRVGKHSGIVCLAKDLDDMYEIMLLHGEFYQIQAETKLAGGAIAEVEVIILNENPGDPYLKAALARIRYHPAKHIPLESLTKEMEVLRAIPKEVIEKSKYKVEKELIRRFIQDRIKNKYRKCSYYACRETRSPTVAWG